MNPEKAVLAALTAALLGIVYAGIVHTIYRADPHHPYTAWLVAFGVSITLLAAGILLPLEHIVVFFVLFGITGTPQFIGAMIRDAQERRQQQAAFERTLREQVHQ